MRLQDTKKCSSALALTKDFCAMKGEERKEFVDSTNEASYSETFRVGGRL
jgi:hypothetical protein